MVGCQDVLPGSAPVDVLPNRWPQGPAARFGPPVSLPIPGPTAIGTASVASTDLNGDGLVDVVAALSKRDAVHIWHSDGMGAFVAAPALGTGSNPAPLLLADVNGDRRGDLVVLDEGGRSLSVFLSQGSGLATRRSVPLPSGSIAEHVAAMDWDQDGRDELALAIDASSRVSIFRLSVTDVLIPLLDLPVEQAPFRVQAAPLQPGGKPTLLAASREGNALYTWPKSASANPASPLVSSALPVPQRLTTADLSSDGRSDAAWLLGYRIALLWGDGAGQENSALPSPRFVDLHRRQRVPRSLAAGDVNGDWLGDLVVGDTSGVQVLLAQQPGQYQPAVAVELGLPIDHVSLADVNADDRPDVVATSSMQPGLLVLLGQGNGTLQAPQRISLPSADVVALRVLDQDGDGRRDVLVLTSDQMYLLRGEAGGRLAAPQATALPDQGSALVALDLDFDGRRDVVIASAASRRLLVWRAQADGSLQLAQRLDTPAAPDALIAEDIDRDGLTDLISIERGRSELHVFLGRSDGSLLPALRFSGSPLTAAGTGADLPLFELSALDLTGDAERDLLTLGTQGYVLKTRSPFDSLRH